MRQSALIALVLFALGGCKTVSTIQTARDGSGRVVVYERHEPMVARTVETLVLIHGWSCNRTVWARVIPNLRDRYRVIAVDLPGHGESPAPTDGFAFGHLADAVRLALDDSAVDQAIIVGHSNGCPVAMRFYRNFPERTRAIVAVDGALKHIFPPEMIAPACPILFPGGAVCPAINAQIGFLM